jgi:luciferase family oxidoreductase group 1
MPHTLSEIPLSLLELCPVASGMTSSQALQNTLDLARHAERLGYGRFWLAEHHNMPGIAAAVPEILIAQVASVTKTMRVGSGGVMLPNHSALHVAEAFKTLEALYPGRIDLGIGRAPGTDGLTALALRRSRDALNADDFDEQLGELFAFGSDQFPEGHPFGAVKAAPTDVPLPPVYLLGSSDYSARLAGQLGLAFAFAYHFRPHALMPALAAYRTHFTPNTLSNGALDKPHAIVTVSVFCAPTDEEARFLAGPMQLTFLKLRSGEPIRLPSPEEARDYPYSPQEEAALEAVRAMQIVGSPDTVRAQLSELVAKTQADELMVTTMMHRHEDRLRSFALVAEALRGVAA